uniref:Uncharacterized protein n=1 Tax=Arundo donax TaxID=35708 RepID=A0A0A9D1K6_ARUDO
MGEKGGRAWRWLGERRTTLCGHLRTARGRRTRHGHLGDGGVSFLPASRWSKVEAAKFWGEKEGVGREPSWEGEQEKRPTCRRSLLGFCSKGAYLGRTRRGLRPAPPRRGLRPSPPRATAAPPRLLPLLFQRHDEGGGRPLSCRRRPPGSCPRRLGSWKRRMDGIARTPGFPGAAEPRSRQCSPG